MTCREGGAMPASMRNTCSLFIGADPNTQWLDRRIALDDKGFVTTGIDPKLSIGNQQPWCFRDRRRAMRVR